MKKCQQKSGGFGGGPMQFAHLATTYAAVNCLCDLGTEEAYRVIDRSVLSFITMYYVTALDICHQNFLNFQKV
ncbi:MAG: hypothetical protein GY775_12930 [Candidatus Scalindua sp.]|nr:hypothetical protein [Candidatus Scalindua sp.]